MSSASYQESLASCAEHGARYSQEVNHMASLHDLTRLGQSIWLDFIDRNLVAAGGLQRLVDGGLTGVTTNPTIFHKAIGNSADYDETIRELLEQDHTIDETELCEALMIGDVQMAADV